MGAGVVVLREGFEASLVVGIVLAFLDRTGRRDGFFAVWVAVAAALALSFGVGIALFAAGAELEGRSEAVFEGIVMLTAAGLLTWMIFWMRNRARTLRGEIEGRTQAALDAGSALGLGLVVFLGVAREGVETALFLFSSVEGTNGLISSTSRTRRRNRSTRCRRCDCARGSFGSRWRLPGFALIAFPPQRKV